MPKIFMYFGFEIYIYVDDHLPVHIHVRYQAYESKFELRYADGKLTVIHQKIPGKKPLNEQDINELKRFVRKYHLQIKNQWEIVHYFKKKPLCIVVRKKV